MTITTTTFTGTSPEALRDAIAAELKRRAELAFSLSRNARRAGTRVREAARGEAMNDAAEFVASITVVVPQ